MSIKYKILQRSTKRNEELVLFLMFGAHIITAINCKFQCTFLIEENEEKMTKLEHFGSSTRLMMNWYCIFDSRFYFHSPFFFCVYKSFHLLNAECFIQHIVKRYSFSFTSLPMCVQRFSFTILAQFHSITIFGSVLFFHLLKSKSILLPKYIYIINTMTHTQSKIRPRIGSIRQDVME